MSEESSGRGPVDAKVETALAFFFVVFSILFIWQSTKIPEPPRNISVGSGTFPIIVGTIMLAVSIALAWKRLREVAPRLFGRGVGEMTVVPLDDDDTRIRDWPAVWAVLGSFLALIAVLETLGFVLTFALFLFGLSCFFSPRHWLRNLVTALCFSLFFYYLFTQVLLQPLPNGILSPLF